MQTAKNQTLASCLATYEVVNCRLKLMTLNWTWTVYKNNQCGQMPFSAFFFFHTHWHALH